MQRAESTDDIDLRGVVLTRRASILERAGRFDDARADVETALRYHERKGCVPLTEAARRRLAGMVRSAGSRRPGAP